MDLIAAITEALEDGSPRGISVERLSVSRVTLIGGTGKPSPRIEAAKEATAKEDTTGCGEHQEGHTMMNFLEAELKRIYATGNSGAMEIPQESSTRI